MSHSKVNQNELDSFNLAEWEERKGSVGGEMALGGYARRGMERRAREGTRCRGGEWRTLKGDGRKRKR